MTNATAIEPHEKPGATRAMGAHELLLTDHKLVNSLFVEYENARLTSKKKELATRIFLELSRHAQVEEEIIYPAAKQALLVETSGVLS